MSEHPWTPENPGAWVDPDEQPTAADLQEEVDDFQEGYDEARRAREANSASKGPMNLGPKSELLPVRRGVLEGILVALGEAPEMDPAVWRRRRDTEAERIRAILRGDA